MLIRLYGLPDRCARTVCHGLFYMNMVVASRFLLCYMLLNLLAEVSYRNLMLPL